MHNVRVINIRDGEELFVTKTIYDKETGLPRWKQTRLNGMLHAPPDGEPSEIHYDNEGRERDRFWHYENLEHREGAPSSTLLNPDTGSVLLAQFRIHGQPRPAEAGPFRMRYDSDGKLLGVHEARDSDFFPDETIELQKKRLDM
ncbi:MAG: hypothetical protein AAFQ05_01015 [Pseudomonadota bacterium]